MHLGPHDYWIYYANIDLRHQYGISATGLQTFLLVKRPQQQGASKTAVLLFVFKQFKFNTLFPGFGKMYQSIPKAPI